MVPVPDSSGGVNNAERSEIAAAFAHSVRARLAEPKGGDVI